MSAATTPLVRVTDLAKSFGALAAAPASCSAVAIREAPPASAMRAPPPPGRGSASKS